MSYREKLNKRIPVSFYKEAARLMREIRESRELTKDQRLRELQRRQ